MQQRKFQLVRFVIIYAVLFCLGLVSCDKAESQKNKDAEEVKKQPIKNIGDFNKKAYDSALLQLAHTGQIEQKIYKISGTVTEVRDTDKGISTDLSLNVKPWPDSAVTLKLEFASSERDYVAKQKPGAQVSIRAKLSTISIREACFVGTLTVN